MIRIALSREPVEVPLAGSYAGVVLTVRRLTSPDYVKAGEAAKAIIRDKVALAQILLRHDLAATAADLARAQADPAFQVGFAVWLGSVECALAGIKAWTGIVLEGGETAPLAADLSMVAGVAEPADPADLAARIAMETLMLDQAFCSQVEAALNQSSRLLAVEGNGSGLSGNGSAGAAPTITGGRSGAGGATKPAKAAPKASGTGRGGAARSASTNPKRSKAAPSGPRSKGRASGPAAV